MSDLESFVSGLSNSIGGYLKQNQDSQRQVQQYTQQSQIDLAKEAAEKQMNAPQGSGTQVSYMDPALAEQALPGYGAKMVQDYNQRNPNNPMTIDQASDFLGKAKDLIDQNTSDDTKIQAAAQKQASSQLSGFQKMYNNDKVISQEKTAAASADTAMDQVHLAVSNPVAYSSVPVTLARMLTGTSRINVQEIQRLGGSQAIGDKANQIMTQMSNGTLTPDNANWMEDVVNTLKNAHQTNIENRGVELASQYRQLSKDDLPTAYQKITGQAIPPRFTQSPTTTAAGTPTNVLESKKAALRAKLGL